MINVIELTESHMTGTKPDIVLPTSDAWIAGGAIRRWFTGEKQDSDIDVFCACDSAVDQVIVLNHLTERVRNDRMIMFRRSPVQIILQPQFHTPEETIEHFDFTICQFAYDGSRIICTIEAVLSSLRKHLAVAQVQKGFEIDSLRRAFKYQRQGFTPCIGTIRDLVGAIRSADEIDLAKFDEISPDRWD